MVKRFIATDPNTGEVIGEGNLQDIFISNHMEAEWSEDKELPTKVQNVIDALTAAANLLDDISYNSVDMKSRMAGIFAAQAIQLKQQIDTLESLLQ